MSTAVATGRARVALGAATGPVLARLALRLIRRGALVVLLVVAGMSAVVVQQYHTLFASPSDAQALEALAENPAIRIMLGPPVALSDPGGFTVWRTGTPVAVVLAVWALLATIRITRGDEEAGRWDLLSAGRCRLSRLVLSQAMVVALVAVVIGLATASGMIIAGADRGGSVLYGAALGLIGAGAAGWGALTGQLFGDRRRAATVAVAGIGAGLLLRMAGDGVEQLDWAAWLSPFGLLGLIQPFGANRVAPVAVLAGAALALGAAALVTSRRRDLGAGLVTVRDRPRPRTGLLRSPVGFAVRRGGGPLVSWAAGVWLYCLVIGLLASAVIRFLADSPGFAGFAARVGFGSLTTVAGFAASMFSLLAVPLGLYGASRISAAAADEEARRLTAVLAAPVSRTRWYAIETVVALAGMTILAVGAGLATWAGATAVGADLGLGPAVAGALNVLPVGWLSLAAAGVAWGWQPVGVMAIGAVPAVGGFLLQILAESLRWPDWVAGLSPYRHLGLVPYEPVEWPAAAVMTLVGAALVIIGSVGFARRDLRG